MGSKFIENKEGAVNMLSVNIKEKMETSFKIESIEEARIFENNLSAYMQSQTGFVSLPYYFNLCDWFSYCKKKNPEIGGQIFTAILDIKINITLLEICKDRAVKAWQEYQSISKNNDLNIISEPNFFKLSLIILENLTTFSFRYRALFDKIFGLIILEKAPNKYDEFRRSRSRKTKFTKIINENNLIESNIVEKLQVLLKQFDKEFRTPEAHGTGSMRKWVLDANEFRTNIFDGNRIKIIEFWHDFIEFIFDFDKISNR